MLFKLFVVAVVVTLCHAVEQRLLEDDDRDMHPDVNTRDLKLKNPNELDASYWQTNAQAYLKKKVQQTKRLNTNVAKNIIFFLGDGMSVHTTSATRVYLGGEEVQLSFEQFPFTGMSKTYCVNKQVADSACTATAYLTGVKGNYGTIGVNAQVDRFDCDKAYTTTEYHTESLIQWAQNAGKKTGIVTTARITHATPAGAYAHTAERDWESDADIEDDKICAGRPETIDIARQLIEWNVGKRINVLMGCGRRAFLPKEAHDEDGHKGRRLDGRNLIYEWLAEHNNAAYVWNRTALEAIRSNETDYLLGLFGPAHCLYNSEVQEQGLDSVKPNLARMTESAIEVLRTSKNGYVLFVEGGLIDVAHHGNEAGRALDETAQFHLAVQRAKELVNDTDTLIVVSADHAHTMTYNGYPVRGNNILGSTNKLNGDGLEYTTLSYSNGEGYYKTYHSNGTRIDIRQYNYTDLSQKYMAGIPVSSASHGGEDVAVYADGPFAHLFTGNYEQNSLPLLMAYAAQIGPYAENGATVNLATISILAAAVLSCLLLK